VPVVGVCERGDETSNVFNNGSFVNSLSINVWRNALQCGIIWLLSLSTKIHHSNAECIL